MITAQEAKVATLARLEVKAKEFILNNVGLPIQDAIDCGKFYTTVSLDKVPNAIKMGEEIVRQLEEQGYKAEHIYHDGPNGYYNYISIKWGED